MEDSSSARCLHGQTADASKPSCERWSQQRTRRSRHLDSHVTTTRRGTHAYAAREGLVSLSKPHLDDSLTRQRCVCSASEANAFLHKSKRVVRTYCRKNFPRSLPSCQTYESSNLRSLRVARQPRRGEKRFPPTIHHNTKTEAAVRAFPPEATCRVTPVQKRESNNCGSQSAYTSPHGVTVTSRREIHR